MSNEKLKLKTMIKALQECEKQRGQERVEHFDWQRIQATPENLVVFSENVQESQTVM